MTDIVSGGKVMPPEAMGSPQNRGSPPPGGSPQPKRLVDVVWPEFAQTSAAIFKLHCPGFGARPSNATSASSPRTLLDRALAANPNASKAHFFPE